MRIFLPALHLGNRSPSWDTIPGGLESVVQDRKDLHVTQSSRFRGKDMRRFIGDAVLSAVWWAGAEGSFSYLGRRGERITAYRNSSSSRKARSRTSEWEVRINLREVRRVYAEASSAEQVRALAA